MIQVTVFSGHEGLLRFDRLFYLTIFGGCDLVRPTIARRLVAQKSAARDGHPEGRRPFFLTVFGGVDISAPTLAAEFLDLRETIESGLLSLDDWSRAMAQLGHADGAVGSFTLFGGFDECKLPTENEEIDSLGVQRHLGNISMAAGQVLQYGIGQRGAERNSTVRRALVAELDPSL